MKVKKLKKFDLPKTKSSSSAKLVPYFSILLVNASFICPMVSKISFITDSFYSLCSDAVKL